MADDLNDSCGKCRIKHRGHGCVFGVYFVFGHTMTSLRMINRLRVVRIPISNGVWSSNNIC